jgi:uncharacterized protein YfaS (alpha-2-macroglobulin family)
LIATDPTNVLIPKLVAGLLACRTPGGCWYNTQDNIFVMIALDSYFRTYEGVEPNFTANCWFQTDFVAKHTFKGRSFATQETLIPLSKVKAEVKDEIQGGLILSKTGKGRLYYRLGMEYVPSDLHVNSLDCGFLVSRSYEAVNNPEDVQIVVDEKSKRKMYKVKAGATVRVNIDMLAPGPRTHVALEDPLPAGLEPISPVKAEDNWRSWKWNWYDHQNLRDDRAEAFKTYLSSGSYNYSYTVRATTRGTFIVPPTKAEEMYSPSTFGRSASTILEVV